MIAIGPARWPTSSSAANRRSTLFCQIETAEGVENADAMAAVDGVDCLWVGHFDLSVSLGIPGQFEHPDFKRAIERTIAACHRHNKALGRLVQTVEQGVQLNAEGFDFICYSGDVWVLHNALADAIARLREGTQAHVSSVTKAKAAGKSKDDVRGKHAARADAKAKGRSKKKRS